MYLLKQGLYEQVINQEILDQLNSLEQDKFIINKKVHQKFDTLFGTLSYKLPATATEE